MNEEQMQVNNVDSPEMAQQGSDMTPEDAKASLGLATRLGEEYLMSMAPPMEESAPEEAPEEESQLSLQEQYPEPEPEPQKEAQNNDVKNEITALKEEIQKALAEDKAPENDEVKKEINELKDMFQGFKKDLKSMLNE